MKIPTCGDRFRQYDTASIHCFPNSKFVTSSGDFFDEDWGQVFPTEFFVDAEEVYFDCFDGVVADAESYGDTGDEGAEFTAFSVGRAETDVP